MPVTPATILQLKSDIRQTRLADEGVILRQEEGEVLVVNEIAIRFIELINGKRSMDELTGLLLQEYEVEPDTLASDLAEYACELLEQGVLTRAEA
ncbi:PqqD family protein [Thiolapillus sp.]